MMAILCTDGQLKLREVERECVNQKWIPLLTFKLEKDESIYLPVFSIEDTAKSFIKRNLPRSWTHAGIYLSDHDFLVIEQKGWKLEHFSFPRKISDLPDVQLSFEIHEFADKPDYKVGRL